MSLQARISRNYRWRIGIVGIALIAFGGWFLYDYKVGWPEKKREWDRFAEVAIDPATGEYYNDWQSRWQSAAAEFGYDGTRAPQKKTQSDVDTQLYYALPCLALGVPFLISALLMGRRYVAADDEALTNHKGLRATWDRITDIDASRWKTKGIAVVRFSNGTGGEQRIVLDDWKYDQHATQAIYRHVRTKLGHDTPDTPEVPQTAADEDAKDPVSSS